MLLCSELSSCISCLFIRPSNHLSSCSSICPSKPFFAWSLRCVCFSFLLLVLQDSLSVMCSNWNAGRPGCLQLFFFVCPYSGSLSMSWHRTALVRSHARLLAAYRFRMSYWCKMVWPIGGRYIGYLSHLAIQCIFCCVPFCNRTWKGMLNTM